MQMSFGGESLRGEAKDHTQGDGKPVSLSGNHFLKKKRRKRIYIIIRTTKTTNIPFDFILISIQLIVCKTAELHIT